MKRRILLITIITISLTLVVGMIQTARLHADVTGRLLLPADMKSAASSASFSADPLIQGLFAQAGETTEFEVAVTNTGQAPTDTYELEAGSAWPVTLFGPDGSTPLADTNGSGTVDTGIVASGQVFTITTKVETPPNALIGNDNMVELTITSFISPSLITTTIMQGAIPAPFVQTLYERSSRSMSLIMSQPNGSWQRRSSPESRFEEPFRFPELAVAETLSGYVYAWSNWRLADVGWVSELEYTLTDKAGMTQTQLTKVADHSSAFLNTYDESPAVAVAPDGRIGIAWYRSIVQDEFTQFRSQNDNVYLTILDSAGRPITGAINLTNNSGWRTNDRPAFKVPLLTAPRIAATGDNHFFVAWESSVLTDTGSIPEPDEIANVHYAIYDADGIAVTDAISLTSNAPGDDTDARYPAIAAAGDDHVLLTWNLRRPLAQGGDDILYTVIDSSGSTFRKPAELSEESELVDWVNSDIVELSSGDFIAAWLAYGCDGYSVERVRYALIKGNNYNQFGKSKCLTDTVVGEEGDHGISLVADNEGRAILTWTDHSNARKSLYYALLPGNNGDLVTDPMIFYQSGPGDGLISTGSQGYGSASRIYMDAAINFEPPTFNSGNGSTAEFDINYGNLGVLTGTNLAITLSLEPSLAYLSGNAPVTPTLRGSDVVWNFPQLQSLEDETISVRIIISTTTGISYSYPLTATISVNGTEASLANNLDRARIVVNRPVYLPLVIGAE